MNAKVIPLLEWRKRRDLAELASVYESIIGRARHLIGERRAVTPQLVQVDADQGSAGDEKAGGDG